MAFNKQVYRSNALLMTTAIIWGTAFVAQRVGMSYVGPLTFNGVRFALGTLFLFPLIGRVNREIEEKGVFTIFSKRIPAYGGGLLAGIVLFFGATLQQVGLIYTTAGKAGFITGLYVIIVPIMGLLLGHRPRWGGWLGVCLATVGLYLLSITEAMTFAPGDLWELLGAFFWAAHVVILSQFSPTISRIKLACTQYGVCALLSLASGIMTETTTLHGLYGALIPILYGGILSVGIAYTLQVVAQKHAPPIHAAVILSLESVFAAIAGWVFLGEALSTRGLAGCILMLSGMIVAQVW